MAWTDCVQFWLMAGWFVSGEILVCAEEEVSLVQWSRLFAGMHLCGGAENDPAFLSQKPCSLRWEGAGLAQNCGCTWGCVKGENASCGSFLPVFCKVGWWYRPLFPLPPCSAVPGSSSLCCPLGVRLLAFLAFSSTVLVCLCPYLAFILEMLMTLERAFVVSSMSGCCRVTFLQLWIPVWICAFDKSLCTRP